MLIIVAARSFSGHRSRQREPEAALDGFIVAAATAVVVFAAILSEYVRDEAVSLAARAGNVGYSLLTITLVAYVARLAVGPGIRNTAWRLIATATGLIVTNDLLLLLDTTGSTWALVAAGVTSPVAFFAATGAILHPDAVQLTEAPTYRPPTLSRMRIALLGAALLTLPIALLGAALQGTDPDIPVLVTGSVLLASLTLGRIMILFRSRERIGDLERALRESGRSFIDATTPAEIATATARTLQLVIGDEARFAAVISSGPETRHLITRLAADTATKVRPLSPETATPSLNLLLGAEAGVVGAVTLKLGESARLGSILVDAPHRLDDAHSLALQTMSAQITQALSSLELREASYQQRAEQRLTALVEQSADIVAVIDENRSITFASPNTDRILGMEPRSLIGTDPASLVHPDDIEQVMLHIARPTLPHETAIITEARLSTKDGDYRWFDITARDFRHDDEVGGIVITARDVTEERAAKIGLRKSERWFR